MKTLLVLAALRFKLLIRQKIGWLSILTGFALVIGSWLMADVSFIKPDKIYWDFALASIFVLSILLSLYLGTQFYSDERTRRTMHLVLSAGVSRRHWLVGNFLGMGAIFALASAIWSLVSFLVALAFYWRVENWLLILQAQWLLFLESLLCLALGLFLGILLRPLLALAASLSLVVLIHSIDSLRRIFTDSQTGRFIDYSSMSLVLWITQLLPPLHWYNLRDFVGYQGAVSATLILSLTLLGGLWLILILFAAATRLEHSDL
jgi:ABC-type transport system involved in multi-copper enzyme maturation permease subunit